MLERLSSSLYMFALLFFPVLIIIGPLLLTKLVPLKKKEENSSSEQLPKELNVGLSVFYVLLSYFLLFFAVFGGGRPKTPWSADQYTELEKIIGNIAILCGIFFSPISSVFMCTSSVLNRRNRTAASLIFQFIPLVICIAIVISLLVI